MIERNGVAKKTVLEGGRMHVMGVSGPEDVPARLSGHLWHLHARWIRLRRGGGGRAVSTTVGSGGTLTVFSSGIASRIVISSGGTLLVKRGGSAVSVTVCPCGTLLVKRGGIDIPAPVKSGSSS